MKAVKKKSRARYSTRKNRPQMANFFSAPGQDNHSGLSGSLVGGSASVVFMASLRGEGAKGSANRADLVRALAQQPQHPEHGRDGDADDEKDQPEVLVGLGHE